jgi:hypothetical protein
MLSHLHVDRERIVFAPALVAQSLPLYMMIQARRIKTESFG